jgi:ABC-type multidrug transport system ATPase subunit
MIVFDDVGKTYRGWNGTAVRAVDRFSLRVEDGDILGIAGPNGAGKSTLLAMLLGFQSPTSGTIEIDGVPPRTYVERYGIGYVPELMTFNPKWRTRDALFRCAVLSGVPANVCRTRVDTVIEQCGLQEHQGKRLRKLSKGLAQRVGLAQALLRDERVLVFDEPTHGLDPVWMLRFRDLVQEIRAANRIIIIASHNLDELQQLTDRVAIIDHGQLQRVVETTSIGAADEAVQYRIQVVSGVAHVSQVFENAVETGSGEFEIHAPNLTALNHGLATLLHHGVVIASFAPQQTILEAQFRMAIDGDERTSLRGAIR